MMMYSSVKCVILGGKSVTVESIGAMTFQDLATIAVYVPLCQTLTISFLVFIVALILRKRATALLDSIEGRIKEGSTVKIGNLELGERKLITETGDLQEDKLKIFGKPDRLQLLFKAHTNKWTKSTKAMDVPGGVVIQVSTERLNPDGSWSVAEALTFVPNADILQEDTNDPDKGRYIGKQQK